MFDELLSIKRYREQLAEVTLQACRVSLQEVQERHKQAVNKLQAFQLFAKQQEACLYANLYKKTVRVNAINYVLACVQSWQEQEEAMLNVLHSIEEELDQALTSFNLARENHLTAQRITEKFIELAQADYNDKMSHAERMEEQEMEEVASALHGRNDWTNHNEVEVS